MLKREWSGYVYFLIEEADTIRFARAVFSGKYTGDEPLTVKIDWFTSNHMVVNCCPVIRSTELRDGRHPR